MMTVLLFFIQPIAVRMPTSFAGISDFIVPPSSVRDRGADLLQPSRAHHRDPVRKRESFLLVMGDEDEGDADLLLDAAQFRLHGRA